MEKALDTAIEQGKLEEAASISDTIATREFAGQVATAFDCVDYVKKQKVSGVAENCNIIFTILCLDGGRTEKAKESQAKMEVC